MTETENPITFAPSLAPHALGLDNDETKEQQQWFVCQ